MMFDAEAWLQVAEICCSNIPEVSREALLRTALNRAYYAALLVLKFRIEVAQGRGTVPSSGTHEALTEAVRSGGDSFKDVRLALFDLRKAREKADYVLNSQELSAADVRKLIVIARWLIRNRLKALPEAEFRRLHVPRP